MKRRIAALQTWWWRLFVITAITIFLFDLPWLAGVVVLAVLFCLALTRPPRSERAPVDMAPPVQGRWVAINSPGTQVPSHGVRAYGQTYAIDILHPTPPGTPKRLSWSLRTRRPESYSSFGEPVYAMAPGTVVAVENTMRDHRSRDTWPALIYLMVFEAAVRELSGLPWILGNHVIVQHDDGTYAAYGHLRRGSVRVAPGQRVTTGQVLGAVGNTGNTTEPHLHVQLMDHPKPTAAAGVPFGWPDAQLTGDVDPVRVTKPPQPTAVAGIPPDGQIFESSVVPAHSE